MNPSLQDPVLRGRFGSNEVEVEGGSPADFEGLVSNEAALWGRVPKDAGSEAD